MAMTKRRVFISFDHDDTPQVVGFLGLRQFVDSFEFYNHKLDRRVQSGDWAGFVSAKMEEPLGSALPVSILGLAIPMPS